MRFATRGRKLLIADLCLRPSETCRVAELRMLSRVLSTMFSINYSPSKGDARLSQFDKQANFERNISVENRRFPEYRSDRNSNYRPFEMANCEKVSEEEVERMRRRIRRRRSSGRRRRRSSSGCRRGEEEKTGHEEERRREGGRVITAGSDSKTTKKKDKIATMGNETTTSRTWPSA
ncbi:unnamed protein product [Nesidiocoris tenuis]|uniref:Uncharacterized protein n=1 Tax=Nesidiocoris tenuis TaxID=355587 RepID=A0A6H5G2Q7_9HEMI|nr:unnamed protein product [Nesidiocoris tenuis]